MVSTQQHDRKQYMLKKSFLKVCFIRPGLWHEVRNVSNMTKKINNKLSIVTLSMCK